MAALSNQRQVRGQSRPQVSGAFAGSRVSRRILAILCGGWVNNVVAASVYLLAAFSSKEYNLQVSS